MPVTFPGLPLSNKTLFEAKELERSLKSRLDDSVWSKEEQKQKVFLSGFLFFSASNWCAVDTMSVDSLPVFVFSFHLVCD